MFTKLNYGSQSKLGTESVPKMNKVRANVCHENIADTFFFTTLDASAIEMNSERFDYDVLVSLGSKWSILLYN